VAVTRERVLAVRSLGLGDLCTAVPALRGLARGFPGHDLVLAAPGWQTPLARMAGVSDVVGVRGLEPLPDELGGVAVAVNLHGSGPQSIERLIALRPRRLITYRHPEVPASAAGPPWRREEHDVDRWCRLLADAGLVADPDDLRVGVPEGARPRAAPGCVVVHPGAASAGRRWPADRFAAVVRHLCSRGLPVAVTGTREETALCEAVAHCTRGVDATVRSLAGATSLPDLMATIGGARAVLSNDTGVAHLATALGTPSVVIFGPTAPSRWGPRSGPHRVVWAGRTGDPHADRLDPGLDRITVEEVIAALDDVLERPRAGRLGRRPGASAHRVASGRCLSG
jgi:ADP-heptose:LPS heptosyltransferase